MLIYLINVSLAEMPDVDVTVLCSRGDFSLCS